MKTNFASSQLLPGIWSSIESTRYCVQVSASALAPRWLHVLQFVQSVLVGKMHDVDGCSCHIGECDGAMRGFSLGLRRP